MKDIFKFLGLNEINSGACLGNGSWLADSADAVIESINPANERLLAKVKLCNTNAYEAIISAADEAFQQWRLVPAPHRGELVYAMGEILRQHKDILGSLVSMEMGKSKAEGDGEVQEMIDMAGFAAGLSRMLYGKTMHSERPFHRMYEQWHPLGIVGVISAFNFPIAVWAWNAFLAAICGNTVVWKPSQKAPLCAIAVQNLCNQVMAQQNKPGIFSLFIADNELANQFVEDPRVKLISFTGSTDIGKTVGVTVAKRMGKCILELGGNNAIIADKTADLNLLVPAIVFGALGSAGQRCTSTRRLIVHEDIFESLITRLISAYKQIKIGDPLDKRHHMGPLIDRDAVLEFEQAVAVALEDGGQLLYGGKALTSLGYYVEPTIIKMTAQMNIVKQETFAPILYVLIYKKIEEALSYHNEVSQGLSSALFTQEVKIAEQFLSAIGSDCGIANINIGTSGAEIGGAFGGEKASGGGREAGSDAWQSYMRRQTNTINWGNNLLLAQGITVNF
jgi:aldehyde dehydrogenase (NAD+)